MQALRTAVAVEESLLELAGGHPAAGIDFAAFLQPDLGEADHHPAKQAQRKGGPGVANPAVIFPQRDVQRVMQAALNNPVAPFELEKAGGIQFFQGVAADEINDLGGFLTLAPDAPAEPGDGLGSGKAHLLRGHFLAVQHPDLVPPPVVLPAQGMGARGGRRGKNAVR